MFDKITIHNNKNPWEINIEIQNELEKKYNDLLDKNLALIEDISLRDHNNILVLNALSYWNVVREKIPSYFSTFSFLLMLNIHDIGKTQKNILDKQKDWLERYKKNNFKVDLKLKEFKKEIKEIERKETEKIITEILKNTDKISEIEKKIIFEVIENGGYEIGKLLHAKNKKSAFQEMNIYLNNNFETEKIPKNALFNISKYYLACDSTAYSKYAFRKYQRHGGISKEKVDWIVDFYKKNNPANLGTGWTEPILKEGKIIGWKFKDIEKNNLYGSNIEEFEKKFLQKPQ